MALCVVTNVFDAQIFQRHSFNIENCKHVAKVIRRCWHTLPCSPHVLLPGLGTLECPVVAAVATVLQLNMHVVSAKLLDL